MHNISQLFTDIWAMRRPDLDNLMAAIIPSVMAGNASVLKTWIDYDGTGVCKPVSGVAIIRLRGPLFSVVTEIITDEINKYASDEAIKGLILDIDGPGGMLGRVEACCRALASFGKPTATVVSGMMASAHLHLGVATDRRFAASETCEIGSIGIMSTFASMKGYYEANGIIVKDIYPDTADLKNEKYRAMYDNDNDGPWKQHLEDVHRQFATYVAERCGIAYDPELPLFRGAMMSSKEAIAAGIIDEMGDISDAVRWINGRALANEVNSQY